MRRSFSAVEVVIVIIILGIIAAMVIPQFGRTASKPEPTPSQTLSEETASTAVVGRLYFLNENMTRQEARSEAKDNKVSYVEFGPKYELYEGDVVEVVSLIREDEVLCRFWGSGEQKKDQMPFGTKFITRVDDLEPTRPKENLIKGEPSTT